MKTAEVYHLALLGRGNMLPLLLCIGIGLAQARSALDVGDAPAPFVSDIEEIHRQNYDRWKAYEDAAEDTAKVPAVDNRASGDPHEIWLLPHTHDDVGWLLTPFGYFNMTVTHILTTVTEDLYANPEHRTSFVSRPSIMYTQRLTQVINNNKINLTQ